MSHLSKIQDNTVVGSTSTTKTEIVNVPLIRRLYFSMVLWGSILSHCTLSEPVAFPYGKFYYGSVVCILFNFGTSTINFWLQRK